MSKAEELQKEIEKVNKQVKKGDISQEQADRKIELLNLEAELEGENAKLSGVGLRWLASMTRGKGTQVIKYQGFNTDDSTTIPQSVESFMNVTGVKANSELAQLLVVGYNDKVYAEASDPIAEYVNKLWSPELQTGFRTAVRAIAKAQELPVEEVVDMVKPSFEKKHASVVSPA